MSYNDEQNESALPADGEQNRTASDFIPKFFRSVANKKFLQGTIDQLIQPGVAEKLNDYVGRKTAKSFNPSDNYLNDVNQSREAYQLEPATVIKDESNNVTFYKDYNDYIGTLNYFGANTKNHSRLNSSEYYSWNPHIDWDKFVNFREYYWAPTGPLSVPVRGQSQAVTSTYTVTTADQGDNTTYIFNDGFVSNPSLKLYRGQTYRFEIDAPGHPMAISISRSFTPGTAVITAGTEGLRDNGLFDGSLYDANNVSYDTGEFIVLPDSGSIEFEEGENVSTLYPDGIRKLGEDGEEVATAYIERGTIEFTIPFNAPDRLYYVSKNDQDTSGIFRIYDIEENTFLDVGNEVLGKKQYTSANGVELSNGMKIKFQGNITPKKYEEDLWYVEGVGDKIVLINEKDLLIPAVYNQDVLVPYDSDAFDVLPFSNASSYAQDKDYIIINRAAKDKNSWSRYNKWFHKDVIEKSYTYNNLPINIDENFRAKRPIIEFKAGLKLYNYGVEAKQDVDLIDTFTRDVFSTIEGTIGYNVDGIELAEGMRVLFAADTDLIVRGKIYEVKFITINNRRQISLVETEDTAPLSLENVLVKQGNKNSGQIYHYHNNEWALAQVKNKVNQSPMFDLCCPQGNPYGDLDVFNSSTFKGTKIFSYKQGQGKEDDELGFPLTYRSLENSGDIVFEFNLQNDSFTIQENEQIVTVNTDIAFLRKYKTRTEFDYVNGWSSQPIQSKQWVIDQRIVDISQINDFAVRVYNNAGNLNDLRLIVYVNNKLQYKNVDYTINRINQQALIRFTKDLSVNDVLLVKSDSKSQKNNNGYYEVPINLDRNPLNEDISEFTLGEVIDHVDSMIGEINDFQGVFPGRGNIRDLGNINKYGKRFVKHATPINLPLYHITNKKYNLVKAIKYANTEYNRFKRVFLDTATTLGFDGETKQHVDKILASINKDKVKSQPFYFSDMLGYGPYNKIDYKVLDSRITQYALTNSFALEELSSKAVYIYLNGKQLTFEKDYTFDNQGYVIISAGQIENDLIEIYEYETTDGSYISPTPSKLGLYPKYYPELTLDDTYQTESAVDGKEYKIYGEVSEGFRNAGIRGWFYPVFTTQQAAIDKDVENGGTGSFHIHQIKGHNRNLYMPDTGGFHGVNDNIEIDAYPVGIPMVRGHDGSYVRAYLDFRDELLLELEKRIFNNIKVDYDKTGIDIDAFEGNDKGDNEFDRAEVNGSLLQFFKKWLTFVDADYTDNFFYDRTNPFTYNYSSALDPNGKLLPGFWRGVYKRAFGTDRPHSNPWEILGIKRKPKWWDTVYGPAPYTSDNLILWRDIEVGKIAEPGNVRYTEKYARPNITSHIPVDTKGFVKAPQRSGYVNQFVQRQSTNNFSFGDESPVETAWRRSSDYPFAIITSLILNKPADTLGKGFDVSRIITNLAGQQVYKETGKNLTTSKIIFPNTFADNLRISTSGFVNYIYNLVASDILTVYNDYQKEVLSITNQLGFKLGSFSDKTKLNLILDSRSPQQQLEDGGIYIPPENYEIFFNTSSPQFVASYSGVVVEKRASGFTIRGYNNENPFFDYYAPIVGSKAVPVSVGGVSEATTDWEAEKLYVKDTIVEYVNNFYRVTKTHTTGQSFTTTNLVKLPEVPTVGGKTALFKRNFDKNNTLSIPYGQTLKNSQDVVDFLLGYGEYLKDIGFDFNFVEGEGTVNDWDQICKEFLFWTTQGWASGTVITLSPAANRFNFQKDYLVVDNINDDFYPYSILQANGEPLSNEFTSLLRDKNSFGIQTNNATEGLYSAVLPLVHKEHVVLIDNKTVFNDIIFQPSTGYRQERIKVTGYRAAEWNGSLNIPGFVFDDAKVTDWTTWKDYDIGTLVKYKQFYYVATKNVPGSSKFNNNDWYRLSEKPESELITNFDYRINQFTDFYSLDTQGFDINLQQMAKQLTGFQKRQYLANIIPDDVSQYKFYQGYIQDKGTQNALDKLFKSLGTAGENTLEFYEEWALQVGRYGNVDNKKQIEINFKQDKIQESPQAIELVESLPDTNFDRHYRILPFQMYDTPLDYNHKPFPTKILTEEIVKSGGFVNEEDVTFVAGTENELPDGDVNQLGIGDYIWVVETGNNPWAVYQHIDADVYGQELAETLTANDDGDPIWELKIDRWASGNIKEGDFIGVKGADEFNLTGFYKVESTKLDKIRFSTILGNQPETFTGKNYIVTKLRNVRTKNVETANLLAQSKIYDKQKFWIEDYENGDWKVIENNLAYKLHQSIINISDYDDEDQGFSDSMAVTGDNKNFFVSSGKDKNGKVDYYRRGSDSNLLQVDQSIFPPDRIRPWLPNTLYRNNTIVVYDIDSTRTYWKTFKSHTSGDVFSDAEIAEYWVKEDNPFAYFDPIYSNFGQSIDVSIDGEYLAIGAPNASYVKTRYKGDFDPDTSYVKGDIVRYRESLWKANRNILPRIEDQPFSTFDSYIDITEEADADSTSLTLLVAGDPGLPNNIVDHFLVRAPADMYNGTDVGDGVSLSWNIRSFAYPTLDNYYPFNNQITEITPEFLKQEHIINEKIDHIFYIDAFVTLPSIGDRVVTDTGAGEVYYTAKNEDSAVIYVINANGTFSVTGELYTINGDFVGFYTEENTYATTDAVGGYWLFKTYRTSVAPTSGYTTTTFAGEEFTYRNNSTYYDVGRGLVYVDVRLASEIVEQHPINLYSNIQDAIGTIGPYINRKNQASFISHLAYTGDNGGTELARPSTKMVIRAAKDYSDQLYARFLQDPNQTFGMKFFENPDYDITTSGISIDDLTKTQLVEDMWDGFIDFEFTEFDFQGDVFEPEIGDILVDVQTPRDGFGGLALTSNTTSAAEVVFYQRNFNRVRVYVKVRTDLQPGNFEQQTNIGRYQIKRLSNPSLRGAGDPDQVIGTVDNIDDDIAIGNSTIGKLLLIDAGRNFPVSKNWNDVIPITDQEYFFFNEDTLSGIDRLQNAPYSLNKDYTQVFNIPADRFGTGGYENQGVVSIYRRDNTGLYQFQIAIASEYAGKDKRFGSKVKIRKNNDLYTLFISNEPSGDARNDPYEWRTNPGAIEIYNQGVDNTVNLTGGYKLDAAYTKGDIVIFKDDYFRANKDIASSAEEDIRNPVLWNNISWRRGKDEQYRGQFNNLYSYAENNIVLQDGTFWKALTNISAGADKPSLTNTSWESQIDSIDYLGYLPNLTGFSSLFEQVYDPIENIEQFADSFDVSENGETLIVKTKQMLSDSTFESAIAIYNLEQKKYNLKQIIKAPSSSYVLKDHDNDSETPDVYVDQNLWANSISLKPDGSSIAVSVPYDDANKIDQGAVWIYNYDYNANKFGIEDNGVTAPTFTLQSPNNEEVERFGYSLDYSNENLAISSLNGDMVIPTRFDTYVSRLNDINFILDTDSEERVATTFDKNFTTFANRKVDKGTVYIFEDIGNGLIYSEQLLYPNQKENFGDNILSQGNHIYVGLPYAQNVIGNERGFVIDYRKTKNTKSWTPLRSSRLPVNLDKIDGMFVYNKRSNEIISYIDYIDPIQGKIAGIVDQELTYKLNYDPAKYNVGPIADKDVDPKLFWGASYVGQVWWNVGTARFSFPYQGSTTFQRNEWNRLLPGATIDIYEWVESDYLPSQWNQLADTDNGLSLGISGTAIYGDTKYSAKLEYDQVSQTFSTKYYFWVENKQTVPNLPNRKLNLRNMVQLIARPRQSGYRYVSLIAENKLVINNLDKIITSDDIVLNIKYKDEVGKEQNEHKQYQIISENLSSSKPNKDIELKWFDSLIGVDRTLRPVPDPKIAPAKRIGIQNKPRQSIFVNRTEALKQTVERINFVCSQYPIVDEKNINNLLQKENAPSTFTGRYDLAIDTFDELEFVSTNRVTPAKLTPIVVNGRILRVEITDPGRGYKIAPSYQIEGDGSGAVFEISINNLGQIINVDVVSQGNGYNDNVVIKLRKFSVLVNADNTAFNKWTIYEYNEVQKNWLRTAIQSYDVSLYWNYVDYYAEGYNQFTDIDFAVQNSYQLAALDDTIGDVVKIENVGSGGWVLLEKISNENTEDYTINYKTIGRQNGTIELASSLYDFANNDIGYDNKSFDSAFYDTNPVRELRIILETIRDDIFIGDIELEYNQLFFASLRYILSEQSTVDWFFKTSFISATHKLGMLEMTPTFKYSNLEDYEEYVKEVKPYSTNIRKFVDSYDHVEPTGSVLTDFDLSPYYDTTTGNIRSSNTTLVTNNLVGDETNTLMYPRKHWRDNFGYQIKDIEIADGGSEYTFTPIVKISGGGGAGATAKAVLGYGKITKIIVTNPGNGYTSLPTVTIEGSKDENGTDAKAVAVLGNGVVRSPHIVVKFDRLSGDYFFQTIQKSETFEGTNTKTIFDLPFPIELDNSKVKVFVNEIEQLRSKYTYENIIDDSKSYTRSRGKIIFTTPPALGDIITVQYQIPLSMLGAEDRIQFAYNPLSDMYGKDLAQLMTGVDYGGVEVRSYAFVGISGWDRKGWYTDLWDEFDDQFEDEVFTADQSTIAVQLSKPLENGVEYNVYRRSYSSQEPNPNPFVRLDDPNFGTTLPVTNTNAIIQSITGDGTTDIINLQDLGIVLLDGDTLIVRKTTSDGSILPDTNSYDTQLSGGDLAYTTATGINAEDIITDGDGFISETAQAGPEELVPGQVFDTLDIKVYTRDGSGQGKIFLQNYRIVESQNVYNLGVTPGTVDSVFVKIDNTILTQGEDYDIDWNNNVVVIRSVVTDIEIWQEGAALNIVTMSQAGQSILDYNSYLGDGVNRHFATNVRLQEDISVYASIDGVKQEVTFGEDSSNSNLVVDFDTAPPEDSLVYIALFAGNSIVNYSQLKKDTFLGDGIETDFELSSAPFYSKPTQYNLIVKVDNNILSPGYNIQYTIPENRQREYALEVFQQPSGSLLTTDIVVFLNGSLITVEALEWRFDIANSSVVLADDVGNPGDSLEIYVITDGEYTLTSPTTVTLTNPPADESEIEIYQFSNHDILEIERMNYDVVSRTTLNVDSNDYITYNRLTVGEIELRKPAIDSKYVWVIKNGTLLSAEVDYTLNEVKDKVILKETPQPDDVLDIMHFTAEASESKFAYRQFKDILNRTHFKRLDAAATTLAAPLNQYDLRIELVSGENLSEPNKSQNLPGIIFIDGERIEYFVKENNILRQLRRGTLGTGIKDVHNIGTKVYDQNISKTVPYRDTSIVQNFTSDGLSRVYQVTDPTAFIDELEVFVGGKRMDKQEKKRYLPIFEQDSPEGDVTIDPDVKFDPVSQSIVLREIPIEGTVISIVKKQGKLWTQNNETLGESDNSISRFLRAGTSELPE